MPRSAHLNDPSASGGAAADRRRSPHSAASNGIPVSLCGDAGGDPGVDPGAARGRPARPLGRAGAARRGQGGHRRRLGLGAGMAEPTDARARCRRGDPRLQDASCRSVHRPAPVRHAPAPCRRARQAPQLRHADHQPGLFDADPVEASADYLLGLPFQRRPSATFPRRLSSGASGQAVDRRARHAQDAASVARSCPTSATTSRTPRSTGRSTSSSSRITSIAGKSGADARARPRRNAMKKLINAVDTVLTESLDGFVAAHADILVLGDEHKFVRRKTLEAGQGRADLRRRLRPRAAACRLRRPRHARRRLPRPGLHLADAGPDAGGGRGGRHRRRRAVHRQELRRRRDELRHGGRDVGGRPCTVVTNDDVAVENSTYTTGRRGVAGTLVVEKIVGAAAEQGMALGRLKALGERVNAATRSMGVALTSLHRAGRRQADLRHRRRTRWSSASASMASPAAAATRLKRADAIAEEICARDPRRSRRRRRRATALLFVNGFGGTPLMELYLMYNSARQILETQRRDGRPLAGRLLRHLARHGRLLDHADACSTTRRRGCGTRRCTRRRCAGGCERLAGARSRSSVYAALAGFSDWRRLS